MEKISNKKLKQLIGGVSREQYCKRMREILDTLNEKVAKENPSELDKKNQRTTSFYYLLNCWA